MIRGNMDHVHHCSLIKLVRESSYPSVAAFALTVIVAMQIVTEDVVIAAHTSCSVHVNKTTSRAFIRCVFPVDIRTHRSTFYLSTSPRHGDRYTYRDSLLCDWLEDSSRIPTCVGEDGVNLRGGDITNVTEVQIPFGMGSDRFRCGLLWISDAIPCCVPETADHDGSWGEWSSDTCSVTCGGGTRMRTRSCLRPDSAFWWDCSRCAGDDVGRESCNTQPCPVDGSWGEWGEYGDCLSSACGTGLRARTRHCSRPPPAHGGEHCPGLAIDMQPCTITPPCVHGGWGEWGDYNNCSATCGVGSQQRRRSCDNPAPDNGGAKCPGDNFQSQTCNTHPCPTGTELMLYIGFGCLCVLVIAIVFISVLVHLKRNECSVFGHQGRDRASRANRAQVDAIQMRPLPIPVVQNNRDSILTDADETYARADDDRLRGLYFHPVASHVEQATPWRATDVAASPSSLVFIAAREATSNPCPSFITDPDGYLCPKASTKSKADTQSRTSDVPSSKVIQQKEHYQDPIYINTEARDEMQQYIPPRDIAQEPMYINTEARDDMQQRIPQRDGAQ